MDRPTREQQVDVGLSIVAGQMRTCCGGAGSISIGDYGEGMARRCGVCPTQQQVACGRGSGSPNAVQRRKREASGIGNRVNRMAVPNGTDLESTRASRLDIRAEVVAWDSGYVY